MDIGLDSQFDEATGDIIEIRTGHDPIEIGSGVDPQQQTTADPAAEYTDQIEKGR